MKKNKKLIIAACVLLCLIIGVFATVKIINYLPFYFDKNGINQPTTEYKLMITKSDFENEVAKRLYDEGIIVSQVRFLGYIHQNYPDFKWLNGEYTLTADMSYKELCQKLQNPDKRIGYVKFTVPEGKNVREIAQIVEKSGLCTKSEFLKAADSYDYDFDFIKTLKNRDQSLIAYKLEGFLFPATYEFREDTTTAEMIVSEMLKAFDDYVSDGLIQKATVLGLDINEYISLASVIQGEAPTNESMVMVSSVFWNRLNSKSFSMLQSCPTQDYANELIKYDGVSEKVANEYNTYKSTGLPVGPINCPGLDAIKATVTPEKTDYFYFVTDKNGKFYFNKTYAQHNATISSLVKQGLWA